MGGQGKLALSLLLAAVLAVLVSACGGGGDSTSAPLSGTGATATGESTTTAPTETKSTTTDGTDRMPKPTGKGGSGTPEKTEPGEGADKGNDRSGGSGGTGASAGERSAEFRTPNGDNSIQSYGEEAGDAEREAASAVVETYMTARAAANWQEACAQIDPTVIKSLEELVAPGSGCPATFVAITRKVEPSAWANTMTGPIASLRVEGDHGFALYHGTGGRDYFVQMTRRDGWLVAGLEPTEFP